MKRKSILITIIAALAFIPLIVNAEVKVLNLKDTLEDKGITISDANYEEKDNQIKIYLFRWASCSHCYDFLVYLNSLVPEYGHMFKLRSYETTMNSDNEAVMKKVKDYFNDSDKSGVPYIVIGDRTFYGYSERMDDGILAAIKAEYEKSDRFDVFEDMEEKEKNKNPNDGLIVIIPIVVIIVIAIIIVNKKKAE